MTEVRAQEVSNQQNSPNNFGLRIANFGLRTIEGMTEVRSQRSEIRRQISEVGSDVIGFGVNRAEPVSFLSLASVPNQYTCYGMR
jgi:hypothetical protein